MTMENARAELPIYSSIDDVREYRPAGKKASHEKAKKNGLRFNIDFDARRFGRRYGILFAAAAFFVIYTVCLSAYVDHKAVKRIRQEMAFEYASQLEQYKAEQAQQVQAEHWLSGDASREAFINQEIDAVAPVIAKLSTDAQKLTEASCMLARVMSPYYPNTFQEVAVQASQWMFYDGKDNTFSQHDRDLAESVIRPYIESGTIPNGLTADLVYGAWSQNDFVLRDSYESSATMKTWRYQ